MNQRSSQLAATIVGLCCALWVAIAPAVPLFHQVLASHRHVYCVLHQQFEDVSSELKGSDRLSARSEEPSAPTVFKGSTARDDGVSCGFSSLRLSAFDAVAPLIGLVRELPPSVTRLESSLVVSYRTREVLGYSPKRSPPNQAVTSLV
jgi:hypothetical protein